MKNEFFTKPTKCGNNLQTLMDGKGAFFKDKRSLGGMGCQPGAVTISDSDVIIISNNDVILRSEGGRG